MEYKLNVAKETNQEVPTNAGGVTCPPMDQKDGRMDGHKRREQVAEVIWMRRTLSYICVHCFSLHKSEQHVHQFTLFDYAVSIGELT
ncbi:uncharacterized protein LOC107272580 isoform X3 [Cephus cinctus]|uniref:Uncharacterized protein LOC107272580 isoform X3 n=1 Tax=Cephus cinctus TaxID=211228 RepID=A0AAJ7RRU2_CEPCN|nr:uncharacterized protein LOC107272580 isoform X3 [Cephus cinctus]